MSRVKSSSLALLAFPPALSLSRYRPIAQIARGGMAEVILAEMNVGSEVTRLAVLKRIWPQLARDKEFLAMFLQEARIGAAMSHPNIVQTFEVLADGPRPAISLEYLAGQPLNRVLSRLAASDTLSWPVRLGILADILGALDYAHERTDTSGTALGIVHRDVSPQNVMITYGGRVKLIDFGVAKCLSTPHQTRPGAVKGKLAYMAPEQLLGQRVDRRADIFAVGVMLWEMAAGRRLWLGMSEASIIRQMSAGIPIRPISVASALPAGLVPICKRALSLDPEQRFPSAAAFAAELERLIVGSQEARARHLGKLLSLAFAGEHAAREALIETRLRHVQGTAERERQHGDSRAQEDERAPSTLTRSSSTTESLVAPEAMTSPEPVVAIPTEPSGSLTVRVNPFESLEEAIPLGFRTSRSVWIAVGFAAALLILFAGKGILPWSGSDSVHAFAVPSAPSGRTGAGLGAASPSAQSGNETFEPRPRGDGDAATDAFMRDVVIAPMPSRPPPSWSRRNSSRRAVVARGGESIRGWLAHPSQLERDPFDRRATDAMEARRLADRPNPVAAESDGSGDDILAPTIDLDETPKIARATTGRR